MGEHLYNQHFPNSPFPRFVQSIVTGTPECCCGAGSPCLLRWEFIKENKRVRKQELDQETDQENKNSTKKTRKQERKQELDQESDQKKRKFIFF